ncbi:MAG: DNA-formamidopyrimidine glycosylase family protein, partial [Acidimicrobiales bacterium]
MPELPEVETIRRQLGPKILNRTVISAGSHESAKFLP